MKSSTSLRGLVLILIVGTFGAITVPAAESKSCTWLDVPILFAGDRKHPGYKDEFEKEGQDQRIGSQSIWYGTAHSAVYRESLPDADLEMLTRLGCKVITEKQAKELMSAKLGPQLAKSAVGITVNIDANDGQVNVFQVAPLSSWLKTIGELTSQNGQLIIFAHGCCIDQEAAFERAAELLVSCKQQVLLYDWSTVSIFKALPFFEINSYRRSERAVDTSTVNFENLIRELSENLPSNQMVLIGHSMGNRLIVETLRNWEIDKHGRFSQVHLVKPDINMQAYLLDEYRLCNSSKKTFVYCAPNDKAIRASEFISFGTPRLGSPGLLQALLVASGDRADKGSAAWFIDVSKEPSGFLNHGIPYALLGTIVQDGLTKAQEMYSLGRQSARSRMLFREQGSKFTIQETYKHSGMLEISSSDEQVPNGPFRKGGDGSSVLKKIAVDKFALYPGQEGEISYSFQSGAAGGKGGSTDDIAHKMIIEVHKDGIRIRTGGFVGTIPFSEIDMARTSAK